MAALKEDYERSLSANAASQKDLQKNLISAKHELLRVQEQLALAEKVHHCGLYLQLMASLSVLNQELAKLESEVDSTVAGFAYVSRPLCQFDHTHTHALWFKS